MAKWTRKFINDLPDSSFALILPGGKKDEEGKTKPRDLRMFPYKDVNGNLDKDHIRAALVYLDRAKISEKDKKKVLKVLKAAEKKLEMGEYKKSTILRVNDIYVLNK